MEQARAVLDLLLHSALVPSEDRPEIAALRGEPEVIEFVAAPPRALEATGLVEVRVTIEPEGAGPLRGIFVATRPLTPPHAGLARQERTRLLSGLRSASFTFQSHEATRGRQQRWDGKELPASVRVQVRRDQDEEPGLMWQFPLRRSAPARCRFDPVARECLDAT